MENMNYTHCDNCGRHNANGHDICSSCITEEFNRVEVNEDAWIDLALHSYLEDGYGGEWDAYHAQYDVADFDIY